MVRSLFIRIFLIISLIQNKNLRCYSVRIKAATVGAKWDATDERFYQYDWQLHSNQIVPAFSRNFGSQFAFVAYDSSDKSKVDIVSIDLGLTDQSGQRICRSQDFLHSDKPTFHKVFVGEGGKKQDIVKILYTDGDARGPGIWIHDVNMTNCKITEGFIYAVLNDEIDPDMFPNDTTEEGRVFQKLVMSSKAQTRAISSNGCYGHCVLKDNEVTCYQSLWNGTISMNYTKLKLPKIVDWFAIHVLKNGAILIATGDCPTNDCQSFTIRKLEEQNKVTKELSIRTLGMKCVDPSKSLAINAVDEEYTGKFCLNFVCSFRESFQYRKHCFGRDFFEYNN